MSQTIELPVEAPEDTEPRRQPPYAVVVLDDDQHTWQYVMETLKKVFGYNETRCFLLTEKIDGEGRASVWTGTLEGAELKRDLIRSAGPDIYAEKGPVKFPLGVELEPLPQ